MRIIDYYNYIATAACILICAAAVVIYARGYNARGKKKERFTWENGLTYLLLAGIILIAAFLRLYKLTAIPAGLQQDEASIGYEAYALARYGIDRNGYSYPVYPITWGCGGGSPLLIYLNMFSVRLFGTGVLKLRLIPAICGILTVLLFFFILREAFGYGKYEGNRNGIALFGAFFLAVCPWHVILSRWSLDSNIMPFVLALATYLFMLAVRKRSSLLYVLSAAVYAICMYTYGSATIVVPITLLLALIYCVRKRAITIGQLVASGVVFLLIFLPLLVFYGVNYLGLPEIHTGLFTINRFTSSRSEEVFLKLDKTLPAQLWNNLVTLIRIVTFGDDSDMLCHFIPGYSTLLEFTFPITFLGIAVSYKEAIEGFALVPRKNNSYERTMNLGQTSEDENKTINVIWNSTLTACIVLSLLITADISRMVMIFLPLIFYFVKGAAFAAEQSKKLVAVLIVLVFLATAAFTRDYFSLYNSNTISVFMPTYGDAIGRAYEVAGDERPVWSTYEGLSSPYMIALYYNEYDPRKFAETVVYKDPYAEFRTASSFGNFTFADLPEDVLDDQYSSTVFVVASSELSLFEKGEGYVTENMGGYSVVYRPLSE
ncbi:MULTISPECIES: ArnT family glycosyltransferase [unclassified Butyrivibrio]|uniref:ArnT family glycosyltransferase n=1 Tax=unclassified Butyrivibrio TaxID=2639466 RepID=UPI0003B4D2C2|nr:MULTISPECIES: glycosyltransferase family 39 protein [unclassified Butyrivibrio]MDC7293748.1 glycosyltransferase family 39 protein [Butyrivibrio sp. DSM 10294]